MKKIFYLFILLIACNKQSYPWFSGSIDDALVNIDDKIIMLDFYADW